MSRNNRVHGIPNGTIAEGDQQEPSEIDLTSEEQILDKVIQSTESIEMDSISNLDDLIKEEQESYDILLIKITCDKIA